MVMVSNQSTGYCPDIDSWTTVAALDRIGVRYPGGFTHPIAFRACTTCDQINVVRGGVNALPKLTHFGSAGSTVDSIDCRNDDELIVARLGRRSWQAWPRQAPCVVGC